MLGSFRTKPFTGELTVMAEKKRKRDEETSAGRRPSKKVAIGSPSQQIKVSVIDDGNEWMPVLGERSLSFCRL